MATERQLKGIYFPAWNRAVSSQEWRMSKGRLVGKRVACYGGPQDGEMNKVYQEVWEAAEKRALQAHRSVTAEDLRHGCHMVALGRDKSASDLTNAEMDRVVDLFKILKDPEDLDALMRYQDPTEGERKRLAWSIEQMAPHAYVHAICVDRFAGVYNEPFWQDLPIADLRMLHRTVKIRTAGRNRARLEEEYKSERPPVIEEEPF